MMRRILAYTLAASMALLAFGADQSTATKKLPAKKKSTAAAHKGTSRTPARRSTTASTSRSSKTGKKGTTAKRTTWRNRQMSPTPERYREIQAALVAKGYLKPEDASGGWNQNSVDALKRFQSEQNLDASGKINSLSLIALGLGPKHDANSVKPPESGPSSDR